MSDRQWYDKHARRVLYGATASYGFIRYLRLIPAFAAVLGAMGMVLGFVTWYKPGTPISLLIITDGNNNHTQEAKVFGDNNLQFLEKSNLFKHISRLNNFSHLSDVLGTHGSDNLVVYVDSNAWVNAHGSVMIPGNFGSSNGDDGSIALEVMLDQLNNASKRKIIVVLNIFRQDRDLMSGRFREDLLAVTRKTINNRIGNNVAVFIPDVQGRPEIQIPGKTIGLFTHFFIEGLSGYAEKTSDKPNGVVDIDDLYQYVTIRMNQWTVLYGYDKSVPVMITDSAKNFAFCYAQKINVRSSDGILFRPYPEVLRNAWSEFESWSETRQPSEAPGLFAEYSDRLAIAEKAWLIGASDDDIATYVKDSRTKYNSVYVKAHKIAEPSSYSVAWYLAGQNVKHDRDRSMDELLAALQRIKVLAEDPKAKPESIIALVESESKKWKDATLAVKDPLLPLAYVVESALKHEWTTTYEILFLARCIGESGHELTVETELLYQIKELSESTSGFDIGLLQDMFVNRILRERIMARPEAWPGIMKIARPVIMKQHEYEMILRTIRPLVPSTIKSEMKRIQSDLLNLLKDQEMVDKSKQLITRSIVDIYWIPRLVERYPEIQPSIVEYLTSIHKLQAEIDLLNQLSNQSRANGKDGLTSGASVDFNKSRLIVTQLNAQLEVMHSRIWRNVDDNAALSIISELKQIESNQQTVDGLLRILEFPRCSAYVRLEAWNFVNLMWKNRSQLDPRQLTRISQPQQIGVDTVNKSNGVTVGRLNAFLMMVRFISPDWTSIEELSELIKKVQESDDTSLSLEKIESISRDWFDGVLVTAEYAPEFKLTDAFAGILYQLRNSLDESLDHKTEKFQEFRRKMVNRFYHDIGEILDFVSMDMGGSTMLRHGAEEIRKITGDARQVSAKITTNPLPARYDLFHPDQVNLGLDLQVYLSAIRKLKEPVGFEFINLPDSPYRCEVDSQFLNLIDSQLENQLSELRNVQMDSRVNLLLTQNPTVQAENLNSGSNPYMTFLMKIRVYDYVFHAPVSFYVAWPKYRPQISFSSDPNQRIWNDEIQFRPIDTTVPLSMKIKNPSPNRMDLTVRLKMKSFNDNFTFEYSSKSLAILPESSAPVLLQENRPVKAASEIPENVIKPEIQPGHVQVPSPWYGVAAPVEREVVVEVLDNNHLELGPVVTRIFRMRTTAPNDFVEMRPLVYQPKLERLVSQIMARSESAGTSPAKVQMRIPVRQTDSPESPVLTVGGNLSGQLRFEKNSALQIVASPVRIDPLGNGSGGRIIFDIDRHERAFVYENRWLQDYDRDLFPLPVMRPEIKLVTEKTVRNGMPIRIKFEPINEPEGGSILLECAEHQLQSDGNLNYKAVHTFASSRNERFAVMFDEKAGLIKVLNGLCDWTYDMPTTGLVGQISLRAKLLDRKGNIVASDIRDVLLDDQALRQANLIDLPEFVKIGNKVRVRMQAQPPASGVKRALVVLGALKDRKIPENAVQTMLAKEDGETSESAKTAMTVFETWSGFLEIPAKAELVGRGVITVVVETGAGLTEEVTGSFKIVGADYIEPGVIRGTVEQGTFVQAELPVVLRKMDMKRTEIARTKTDRQGQFQILGIAPGMYGIFTAKSLDQTAAQAEVLVKSGQTTTLRLKLGRVNLPSNGPAPKAEAAGSVK